LTPVARCSTQQLKLCIRVDPTRRCNIQLLPEEVEEYVACSRGMRHPEALTLPGVQLCNFALSIVAAGRRLEPEVYPRMDGSVYSCGEAQDVPLPESAADVVVRSRARDSGMGTGPACLFLFA
jgi:hypothetical protein